MSNLRKIIAWILIFAITISMLVVSASAASGSAYEQKVGFWDWAVSGWSPLNDFVGYVFGAGCPKSEDGYHHANSYQVDEGNGYYKCICSYCGHSFTAYESDLKQAYDNQVSELPATGITSDGSLLYSPVHGYFQTYYYKASSYYFSCCEHCPDGHGKTSRWNCSFDCTSNIVHVFPASGTSTFLIYSVYFSYNGIAPVDGYYTLLATPVVSGYWRDSSGTDHSFDSSYSEAAPVYYASGTSFSKGGTVGPPTGTSASYIYAQGLPPVYKIVPTASLDTNTYNINTRPTTITGGNYGIVGDNGTINTVTTNNQIISETNNTYYNPATGQTFTVLDWTYDYGDRTYSLNLEGDISVDVRYGDDEITITENNVVEGDTVVNNYTIYYMVNGTSCTHNWQETSRTEPTCTAPGKVVSSCSNCGETRTETLPALGHSWKLVRTVATTYDEEGNLTQEGYTIYECERCGEQYKASNNAGPPSSGGGGSGGGSGSGSSDNIFGGIFGIIWDFLRFMFDLFSDFVVGGIRGFIDALLDVGSDFFAILNPFDWGY